MLFRMMNAKTILSAAMFGVFLLASGVTPVKAGDRDECHERVEKAEAKYRREVERHGEHSRQAERRHEDLERARESCGDRDRDHDHDRH